MIKFNIEPKIVNIAIKKRLNNANQSKESFIDAVNHSIIT